ncbi:GNAT family N-acetyltransferase [Cohnella sp. GCM10012308]|uniref:GNAT family N-acetyltransferase n=1 Tax=Cohnella sp. GCM10012308 TaxID=3317329 RepID=UPI003612C657
MDHLYKIQDHNLTIEPIRHSDLEIMRIWRNSEWARFYFLNSTEISSEQQEKWYLSYLNKENDYMFMIIWEGQKVGVVALYNHDLQNKTIEFGRLLLVPEMRGKGIAKKVVFLLTDLSLNELEANRIVLEVLQTNKVAAKLYEKCGFHFQGEYIHNGRKIIRMEKWLGYDET